MPLKLHVSNLGSLWYLLVIACVWDLGPGEGVVQVAAQRGLGGACWAVH
jgi:hypothetical protein